MIQRFLPIISIASIVLAQLATFILFYFFDKEIAGKIGVAFLWASFSARIVFFGGEQSLVKRLLASEASEYVTGFSLYGSITTILFLCSIPLVFLFGDLVNLNGVELLFLITFLMLLILQWLEIYSKAEGRYGTYQLLLFFSSLLLVFCYLLAYFYNNLFGFIIGQRAVIFSITSILLLLLFTPFINKFSLQGWRAILKSDYAFVILLTISLINVFIDRIFISATVEPDSYADYMMITAIYSLAIMPKSLLANQYLVLLKTDVKGYFDKVKRASITYVYTLLVLGFFAYWFVTSYLLVNYEFLPLIYGILAISAAIEVLLGPAGMVNTFKYNPKHNLFPEIAGVVTFLMILLFFGVSSSLSSEGFLSVAIALAFSKVVIAYTKLVILKRLQAPK